MRMSVVTYRSETRKKDCFANRLPDGIVFFMEGRERRRTSQEINQDLTVDYIKSLGLVPGDFREGLTAADMDKAVPGWREQTHRRLSSQASLLKGGTWDIELANSEENEDELLIQVIFREADRTPQDVIQWRVPRARIV